MIADRQTHRQTDTLITILRLRFSVGGRSNWSNHWLMGLLLFASVIFGPSSGCSVAERLSRSRQRQLMTRAVYSWCRHQAVGSVIAPLSELVEWRPRQVPEHRLLRVSAAGWNARQVPPGHLLPPKIVAESNPSPRRHFSQWLGGSSQAALWNEARKAVWSLNGWQWGRGRVLGEGQQAPPPPAKGSEKAL